MTKRIAILLGCIFSFAASAQERPNIILIMTDDQGWGQTGYYGHPLLKTPNLDKMAKNGLRLDRFYAGAPVCSPTRASVLTGRSCVRAGVPEHGYALRRQEKVLSQALKEVGYATGHFGKWHLNGLRGPGVPVFKEDTHSPGAFGFDSWITVSNFFDIDPIMSRSGVFEEFRGTSSEIIVDEALKFIEKAVAENRPSFTVIWDGSPHDPFVAREEDMKGFEHLDSRSKNHYGELVAFDRSLGKLRKKLRQLQIAENTMVWYCSDNGGLPRITPQTVGGLRGNKGTLWEGGIRVPCIIEWEGRIAPKISTYPASTMDIFPTIVDMLDLPPKTMLNPTDGESLKPLLENRGAKIRKKPIPFIFRGQGALIDNQFKLVATSIQEQTFQLFNLEKDKTEATDVSTLNPKKMETLKRAFMGWYDSVNRSVAGLDYPEKEVDENHPIPHFWKDDPKYGLFVKEHGGRPEYSGAYKR
ncbi:sulfatase-like hydrolase/transferase [Ulvibacterium sp.]|uniref:sulfatase family protein n=1 Tax=Ulvibacterium sp. TaxID=2665914 RepID=UPI002606F71E|nr:sulfatase-like hydrolase/transferase [Ulvibacterium sp.]